MKTCNISFPVPTSPITRRKRVETPTADSTKRAVKDGQAALSPGLDFECKRSAIPIVELEKRKIDVAKAGIPTPGASSGSDVERQRAEIPTEDSKMRKLDGNEAGKKTVELSAGNDTKRKPVEIPKADSKKSAANNGGTNATTFELSPGLNIERLRLHGDFNALLKLVEKVKALRNDIKRFPSTTHPTVIYNNSEMEPRQIINAVSRMRSLVLNEASATIPRGSDILLDSLINEAFDVLQKEVDRCEAIRVANCPKPPPQDLKEKAQPSKRKLLTMPPNPGSQQSRKKSRMSDSGLSRPTPQVSANMRERRRDSEALEDFGQTNALLKGTKKVYHPASARGYYGNPVSFHSPPTNERCKPGSRTGQYLYQKEPSFIPGHHGKAPVRGTSNSHPLPGFGVRQIHSSGHGQLKKFPYAREAYEHYQNSLVDPKHFEQWKSTATTPRIRNARNGSSKKAKPALMRPKSWNKRPMTGEPNSDVRINLVGTNQNSGNFHMPSSRRETVATNRPRTFWNQSKISQRLHAPEIVEVEESDSDDEVIVVGVTKPMGRNQGSHVLKK